MIPLMRYQGKVLFHHHCTQKCPAAPTFFHSSYQALPLQTLKNNYSTCVQLISILCLLVVSVRHPSTYKSPHPLPTSQIRLRFIQERIKLNARVASIHAIFQLMVRRIQMFFSLKHSASQGESSLKISARWGSPFRRS